MFREKDIADLAREADVLEKKAQSLRDTVEHMRAVNGQAAKDAQPQHLRRAIALRREAAPIEPAKSSRGKGMSEVIEYLQENGGTASRRDLMKFLQEHGLTLKGASSWLGRALIKGTLKKHGRGRKARWTLGQSNSQSNSAEPIVPIQLPPVSGLTTKLAKYRTGYAVWLTIKAANRPMSMKELAPSLEAIGLKAPGQALGALVRYNILRVDQKHSTTRQPRFVIGQIVPPEYAQLAAIAANGHA